LLIKKITGGVTAMKETIGKWVWNIDLSTNILI